MHYIMSHYDKLLLRYDIKHTPRFLPTDKVHGIVKQYNKSGVDNKNNNNDQKRVLVLTPFGFFYAVQKKPKQNGGKLYPNDISFSDGKWEKRNFPRTISGIFEGENGSNNNNNINSLHTSKNHFVMTITTPFLCQQKQEGEQHNEKLTNQQG